MLASPCINVCHRWTTAPASASAACTLDEIASWSQADDGRRLAILAAVARRRSPTTPRGGEPQASPRHERRTRHVCIGICQPTPIPDLLHGLWPGRRWIPRKSSRCGRISAATPPPHPERPGQPGMALPASMQVGRGWLSANNVLSGDDAPGR